MTTSRKIFIRKCQKIEYEYLFIVYVWKTALISAMKNGCSPETAPIFLSFLQPKMRVIAQERDTGKMIWQETMLFCQRRCEVGIKGRGMKKLLWAVKTPYNALCKAIGKGCSLRDTPIFCVVEDRLMVSVKLLPESG